jgi:hypothetical protein
VTAQVVCPDRFINASGGAVHGEWWWTPEFPAEVRLAVGPVEWVIGRDLLTAGLEGPAGEGDVQLVPGAAALWVDLLSPHGTVLLRGSLRRAEDFLARTWKACPRRVESAALDAALDAFLTEVEVQRMTAPRGCPGIRPRTWVLLFLAGLAVWTVLAGLTWLVVGWLAS